MKNIAHIDNSTLDNQPKKVSIRLDKDTYDTFGYDRYERFPAKGMYNRISRFIDKYIGQKFDDIYKKFCDKLNTKDGFPEYIGDWSMREHFLNHFENMCKYNWICEYYIDEHGIIRKNDDRWKRSKPKLLISDDNIYTVEFKKEVLNNYKEVNDAFYHVFGSKLYEYFMSNQYIPYQVYMKHLGSGNRNKFDWYCSDHKIYIKGVCAWNSSHIEFKDLFKVYTNKTYIQKGDCGYEQAKAEYNDALNKSIREKKKEKKLFNENLLHNIIEKKRLEELEKNIINRDRLGFDDNSFVGEPYHGQKRKKK